MTEELKLALHNSTAMFVTVAVLVAVYNLISGLLFTDKARKARFKLTCITSIIAMVIFGAIYMLKLPDIVILGVCAFYTLLSFIFAVAALARGSEDKPTRSFQLSRTFAFAAALLFLAFVIMRQYDLVVYADALKQLVVDTKYPAIANIEGALSNNLFHGFAIAMCAIAAIGTLAMVFLNLWKEDKYRFSILAAIVMIVAYMVFPMYGATYKRLPTVILEEELYPDPIKVSGIGLLLGLQDGVGFNFILIGIIFLGIFGFIVCQMREFSRERTSKSKVVKAIFLMIAALGFIFTSAFANSALTPAFLSKIKVVEDFAAENGLASTIGVKGIASSLGLLVIVFAILSIIREFLKFVKHYRYLVLSVVALVASAMVFTGELYRIPGVAGWTGYTAMLGILGASNFNIIWVVALVSMVLGIISGLLAQADDPALCKFFRRFSAFFLLVAGIIVFAGEAVIETSLTPTAKTVLSFQKVAGREITVSDTFLKAGIMLIGASVIMVLAGWKNFILGLVRFVRDGAGRKFFATLGAIALVGIVAFLAMSGSLQTQILVEGSTVVADYTYMEILTGANVPTGNYGLVMRFAMLGSFALIALAAVSMLFGDLIYKKKYGIQKFAFVLVVISFVVLALLGPVGNLFIGEGIVIYSHSLAVFACLMLLVAIISMYKAAFAVIKGGAEFIVNNAALNAAVFSFIFIVLYMLGILA